MARGREMGGGDTRVRRRRSKAKTSRGPQGLPTQASSRQRPVRRKRPAPVVQPGPIRQSERTQAERYKRTGGYRKSVRAGYRSRPLATRRRRARRAATQTGPEADAITKLHGDRVRGKERRERFESRFTGMSDLTRRAVDRYEREQAGVTRTEESLLAKIGAARNPRFAGMTDLDRGRVAAYESRDREDYVKRILSKANQDKVMEREWRKKMEGPRDLPGTQKNRKALEAGIGGIELGKISKMADTEAREDATRKIADAAFKAGASEKEVAKALQQMAKRHKSPALTVLEQFTRPSSAVAGAVGAAAKGKNPLRVAEAAGKGFVKNDQRFAKVIGGKNPSAAEEVGGFVLDVALDPLTYLTLGTARPALQAARVAAKEAAQEAVEKGINRAGVERAATQAAEAAWKKHGGKGRGLQVGLRGTPIQAASAVRQSIKRGSVRKGIANATREVRTSGGASSRLISTPLRAGRMKMTGKVRQSERGRRILDRTDEALQSIHSYRPREFSPVEWDRMVSSGREMRAATNLAERMGENRWRTFSDELKARGIPAERHRDIVNHIESGNIAKLPQAEREVAEAMRRDFESMRTAEAKAGVRAPDEAVRDRGDVGETPVPDVKPIRKDRDKARREAAAAEREVREATEGLIHAQGRAEVLSRNVGGRKAEVEAERLGRVKVKPGHVEEVVRYGERGYYRAYKVGDREFAKRADAEEFAKIAQPGKHYAAGGHGIRSARERLQKAEKRRESAIAVLRQHDDAYAKTLAQRQAARLRNAKREKDLLKAKAYVPRYIRPDILEARGAPAQFGKPGGQRASSTSTKARKDPRALVFLDDSERGRFVEDIPTLMGERTAESFRLQALGKFNDQMAGLAQPLRAGDDVDIADDLADGLRFYTRSERGELIPVWRTVDTPDQIAAKVQSLLERGDEVLEIRRSVIEAGWALNRRGRVAKSGADTPFGAAWDSVQRKWKWLATQPNPGYHARNLMGDAWNARLGGATARDVQQAVRLIAKERRHLDKLTMDMANAIAKPIEPAVLRRGGAKTVSIQGEKVSDGALVLLAELHGVVRSGFTGRELQDLRHGREIRHQGKATKGLQSVSEAREDIMRMASFLRALKRGDTPEEAAAWANKHHFDYGDLTPLETNVLRRLIPFYTFMARNTPLQLASLMMSPGRFATMEKARNTTEQLANLPDDWEAALPEFVQQSVPFGVPSAKGLEKTEIAGIPVPLTKSMGLPLYQTPMLPLTDLNNVHPMLLGKRILSSITPLIKLPLEAATQYDFYYRDKIRKDLVPAPSWVDSEAFEPVKTMFDAIALALPGVGQPTYGKVKDRRTGKEVPAWPWWMDKLARSTPPTGLLASATTEGRERRPGDKALSVMNWLSGVRRAAIDPTEVYAAQLFEDLDALDEEIELAKQRSLKHKAGEAWPKSSKVGKLNKRKAEVIDELRRVTGEYADPYFARPAKKGKKKESEFSFGGSTSSSGKWDWGK